MLLVLSRRGREEPQCGFEIASDYYFGSTAQAQRGKKFKGKNETSRLASSSDDATGRQAGARARNKGKKGATFRVTVSQSDKMAETPTASTPRYYFRFVDTIGFGSCDACYRIGPVNHLCLHCCVAEGMTLGACFVCQHEGPVWEECQWCERGRCLDPGYGQCQECEWHGTVGDECRNCEDGFFTPLSDSGSVDIIVSAELQQDSTDSDDSDQPVAARTRSLDQQV
jgi:hypothetical protein